MYRAAMAAKKGGIMSLTFFAKPEEKFYDWWMKEDGSTYQLRKKTFNFKPVILFQSFEVE